MQITAKNWHQFQHYKTRNPPWIKLHRSLLDDFEFQGLPDASRALAPVLWLLASEKDEGMIETTLEKLSFRLRRTTDEIRIALIPLIQAGFFMCDSPMLALCNGHAIAVLAPRNDAATLEKRREVSTDR